MKTICQGAKCAAKSNLRLRRRLSRPRKRIDDDTVVAAMQRRLAQLQNGPSVCIPNRGWLAFDRRQGAVRYDGAIIGPCDEIAGAVIEADCMHSTAELGDRLLMRNLMTGDLVLQRLSKALCRLHDRTQLINPVVDHALVQQRGGDSDGGDECDSRQPHQSGELCTEPEMAEYVHGDALVKLLGRAVVPAAD